MHTDTDETPAGLDAEMLMRLSAHWLLKNPDPAAYLDHLAAHGASLFAEAITDDPAEVAAAPAHKVLRADAPSFFRSMGWNILRALPLPALGWKPHRLQPPGRNGPCLCGSGAKYKHCCQDLMERAPRLDPVYLGAVVVQLMPASDWAALPASAVPPDTVAAAAHALHERGESRLALRLLEPWAKLPAPWPGARLELLDLLADLYLDLGHPRKRKALAEKMVKAGDADVQSLGWQRLSMIASDRGDAAAARAAFERAQRLTPDEPRVALLEVTTLLGGGELDRAHERADFHARRMARLPHAAELAPQIEGLQAIARGELDHLVGTDMVGTGLDDDGDADGDGLPFDLDFRSGGVFDELQAWVLGLPAPKLRLDLSRATPQDLGELTPDKALARALPAWRRAFAPDDDGLSVLEIGRWQPLLQRTPVLLDSFEVLSDLIDALHIVPLELCAGLQATLLGRALDLWSLLRARFPQARCEWGWLGNRPALRLLAARIDLDRSPRADDSFEWLRAMVEVLNPHDNQGLRDRLGAVLLRRGDAAAALAVAERYPDDYVGIELVRTRALLALQRLPEAGAALAGALKANRHVLALLRKTRAPHLPDVDSFGVGSPEQARIVVAGQHDLWRDKALQAWLKQQADAGPGDSPQLTLT
jgi:tetratricopeptide (TPR) repeat protein